MCIERDAIVQAVDKDTQLSAATHLSSQSAANISEAFLSVWVAPYIGFPDNAILGQGLQLQSLGFASFLGAAGIDRVSSGVKVHNALGSRERCHKYLRDVYEKVRHEWPAVNKSMTSRLAVKAIYDTAGSSRLVPTLLIFGAIARMPLHPGEFPAQREWMKEWVW